MNTIGALAEPSPSEHAPLAEPIWTTTVEEYGLGVGKTKLESSCCLNRGIGVNQGVVLFGSVFRSASVFTRGVDVGWWQIFKLQVNANAGGKNTLLVGTGGDTKYKSQIWGKCGLDGPVCPLPCGVLTTSRQRAL